jgi:hypothetical protein
MHQIGGICAVSGRRFSPKQSNDGGCILKRISALFAVGLLAIGSASAAPITIDNFTDTQSVTASGAAPQTQTGGIAAAGAIGGARNVLSSITNGNGSAVSNINNGGTGRYEFSLTSGENGYFQLLYDGNTNNSLDGDLNADLTDLGTNTGLLINIASDLIAPITIDIYSSLVDISSITLNSPGGNVPQNIFIPFASFANVGGVGASFNDVMAITIFIDAQQVGPTTGLDGSIDFIEATNTDVPEPGSMLLLAGGLIGFALMRRRK